MGKSIIALFLSCFLLLGSMILPLGDFSLMQDLPNMYRSYCEIRVGEPDVIDFVGDYLLGGKEFFGHNKGDSPIRSDGSLQYQHQANLSIFFLQYISRPVFMSDEPEIVHSVYPIHFHTSDYQNEHFRPPLG